MASATGRELSGAAAGDVAGERGEGLARGGGRQDGELGDRGGGVGLGDRGGLVDRRGGADAGDEVGGGVGVDRRAVGEQLEQAFASAQSIPGSLPYAVPGVDFDNQYGTLLIGARTDLMGLDANVGATATFAQEAGDHATLFITVGNRF